MVGYMASSIAHDIRNPLTAIKGFARELAGSEDTEERREFEGIVSEEADRISSLIEDLLDFAKGRRAELRLRTVDVGEFLDELKLVLRRQLEPSGIEVRLAAESAARVRIDVARIRRVIQNLAANAREAMAGTEGSFSVEATCFGDKVTIRVQDTGPGVPDEIAEKLFEPFVTHGKSHGTGLGLAISKQIVEGHGGSIHLDREAPPGACFVIDLPAVEVPGDA